MKTVLLGLLVLVVIIGCGLAFKTEVLNDSPLDKKIDEFLMEQSIALRDTS
jgi:uncharacterized protein YxeA